MAENVYYFFYGWRCLFLPIYSNNTEKFAYNENNNSNNIAKNCSYEYLLVNRKRIQRTSLLVDQKLEWNEHAKLLVMGKCVYLLLYVCLCVCV